MNEELEKAQRDYDAALKSVREQHTGKPGNANEIRYAEAYQRLVQAGGAPQIKLKYRQAKKYR